MKKNKKIDARSTSVLIKLGFLTNSRKMTNLIIHQKVWKIKEKYKISENKS